MYSQCQVCDPGAKFVLLEPRVCYLSQVYTPRARFMVHQQVLALRTRYVLQGQVHATKARCVLQDQVGICC